MSSVSVVLGSYNGAQYIREQLSSIAEQTLRPAELLVLDDGSTDDTVRIVHDFRRRAPFPVIVVENPSNVGFADNFLNGASMASSDFVSFSDQDDVWYPDKLARQCEALVAHGALLCAHAVDLVDADGNPAGRQPQGIDRASVLSALDGDLWRYYFGFTIMFRREVLDVVPWRDRGLDTYSRSSPLSHDRFVCLLAHSLGDVVELDTPLAAYRQHGQQLYGSGRPPRRSNVAALWTRQLVAAKCRALTDEQRTLREASALRAHLFSGGRAVGQVDEAALGRASARWELEGQRHGLRAAALESATTPSAVLRWSKAVHARVYSRTVFGPRAMLKDLVASVLPRQRPDGRPDP